MLFEDALSTGGSVLVKFASVTSEGSVCEKSNRGQMKNSHLVTCSEAFVSLSHCLCLLFLAQGASPGYNEQTVDESFQMCSSSYYIPACAVLLLNSDGEYTACFISTWGLRSSAL